MPPGCHSLRCGAGAGGSRRVPGSELFLIWYDQPGILRSAGKIKKKKKHKTPYAGPEDAIGQQPSPLRALGWTAAELARGRRLPAGAPTSCTFTTGTPGSPAAYLTAARPPGLSCPRPSSPSTILPIRAVSRAMSLSGVGVPPRFFRSTASNSMAWSRSQGRFVLRRPLTTLSPTYAREIQTPAFGMR